MKWKQREIKKEKLSKENKWKEMKKIIRWLCSTIKLILGM